MIKSHFILISLVLLFSCTKEIKTPMKKVLITIDDAPNMPENSLKMVNLLNNHNVKATFFVIGKFIETSPEVFTEISRYHVVGNHTYNHIDITKFDYENVVKEEIQSNEKILNNFLKKLNQPKTSLFRPPFGETNSYLIKKIKEDFGLETLLWNSDASDWNPEIPVNTIIKHHKDYFKDNNEGILLFHLSDNSVIALNELIYWFKENNIIICNSYEEYKCHILF
jgi:peptidoglycan-N-acetylglucosamine deacetylase